MKKWLVIFLAGIAVAGCSARAVVVNKKVDYDQRTEARVRVYLPNGNRTTFVLNDTQCGDVKAKPGKVSKNPFSRQNMHNGLPKRTLKNISVGMPATERSLRTADRSSYFETDVFREQVVTAGKPAVVKGSSLFAGESATVSCNIAGEFTPKAGKDYEIDYRVVGGYCRLFIYELKAADKPQNQAVRAEQGKEVSYRKCHA
ncbi:hypothetical protein [Bergeriella denitrificans]|uniref:Lipoprotein n=1 Tax=Bergeriella denitrificans TaxID=494 RepID=A0A378UJC7_BERDE|nr:hypothetical protein [Bergeriella denitrificans]STZ76833.1 Uncharacterised protein [Bergeriella denitrificans]